MEGRGEERGGEERRGEETRREERSNMCQEKSSVTFRLLVRSTHSFDTPCH
jgi:hypothetical protein